MRGAALIVVLALTGCRDETEIPTPPDLSALSSSYESATGTLTDENAAQVVDALYERVLELQKVVALAELVWSLTGDLQGGLEGDGVTDFGASEDGLGVRRQGLSAEGAAWARVTHICPGWAEGPVDEKWGRIRMDWVLSETARDVLWGAIEGCRVLSRDGEQVRYDGDVKLRIGESLLVDFAGRVEREGVSEPLDFDLNLLLDAGAEAVDDLVALQRVEVGGARFVGGAGVGSDGTAGLVLRDAGGTWRCVGTRSSGSCTRGGEEVTW